MLRRRRSTLSLLVFCFLVFSVLSYLTFSDRFGQLQALQSLRWQQSKTSDPQAPSSPDTPSGGAATTGGNDVDDDTSNIEPIAAHDRVNLKLDWDKEEAYYPNKSIKQSKYLELFAVSTANKKYFNLSFGLQESLNPGIIPHPNAAKTDTWVMVAELQRSKVENSVWFAQLICDAQFNKSGLHCVQEPMILPLASTRSKHCEDQYGFFAFNVGPHDGRIFNGPDGPFVMYGSNSQYGCFGLWMQDLRMLADWGLPVFEQDNYRFATELQKPDDRRQIEKNWFIFWDSTNQMYAQYQTSPHRAYVELHLDGSTGRDMGYKTKAHDVQCMRTYLPETSSELDSIRQSTNTLSVTLCKRHDPKCVVNGETTYLMTIIQHKSFHGGQFNYESYVYLFQREKPFKIHGIGKKPLWINGRGTHQESRTSDGTTKTTSRPEWFYITGMSWKDHGQTYQGYIDDVLFLSFGIEGERSGAIDVRAGDLLSHIGLCYGRFSGNPLIG